MANRDDEFPLPERTPSNPFGAIVEDRVWYKMKISTIVEYYHTIHKTGHFAPYDPYFDCFVLFHPGLGHPASSHEWEDTLPLLLDTKVPIISTGYTQFDLERDVEWVHKKSRGEFDILLEPGENVFRSLRWDLNDMDPQDVSCGNWGVWAFRGKRYVYGILTINNDISNEVFANNVTDMRPPLKMYKYKMSETDKGNLGDTHSLCTYICKLLVPRHMCRDGIDHFQLSKHCCTQTARCIKLQASMRQARSNALNSSSEYLTSVVV